MINYWKLAQNIYFARERLSYMLSKLRNVGVWKGGQLLEIRAKTEVKECLVCCVLFFVLFCIFPFSVFPYNIFEHFSTCS